MFESVYFAVAIIGLLHGLEPGHGWPVAVLYATRTSKPVVRGLAASGILSFFHLISSFAVVVAYVLLRSFLAFSIPYINFIAGGSELPPNHWTIKEGFEGAFCPGAFLSRFYHLS